MLFLPSTNQCSASLLSPCPHLIGTAQHRRQRLAACLHGCLFALTLSHVPWRLSEWYRTSLNTSDWLGVGRRDLSPWANWITRQAAHDNRRKLVERQIWETKEAILWCFDENKRHVVIITAGLSVNSSFSFGQSARTITVSVYLHICEVLYQVVEDSVCFPVESVTDYLVVSWCQKSTGGYSWRKSQNHLWYSSCKQVY